jgi:hypothetical protein
MWDHFEDNNEMRVDKQSIIRIVSSDKYHFSVAGADGSFFTSGIWISSPPLKKKSSSQPSVESLWKKLNRTTMMDVVDFDHIHQQAGIVTIHDRRVLLCSHNVVREFRYLNDKGIISSKIIANTVVCLSRDGFIYHIDTSHSLNEPSLNFRIAGVKTISRDYFMDQILISTEDGDVAEVTSDMIGV